MLFTRKNHNLCCDSFSSSCKHLLQNTFVHLILWLIFVLIVSVNIISIIANIFQPSKDKLHSQLLVYMSMSDILISVYLSIIGITDSSYKSLFMAFSEKWRTSFHCEFLGFTVIFSVEASAILTLMTSYVRFAMAKEPLAYTTSSIRKAFLISMLLVSACLCITMIKTLTSVGDVCLFLTLPANNNLVSYIVVSSFLIINMVIFISLCIFSIACVYYVRKTGSKTGRAMSVKEKQMARRLALLNVSNFISWLLLSVYTILQ